MRLNVHIDSDVAPLFCMYLYIYHTTMLSNV